MFGRSTNLKGSERDLWRYEFVMIVSQLESRAHLHGRTDCHRRSHPCGSGVSIIVVKRCYCCWFPAWCPWTPPECWVEQDAPESAIVCFLKMHQSWKSTWALSSLWGSWSSSLWKSSWWCLPSAVSCTASPQWRCLCQSSCRDQGLARTQVRKWPWSGVGLNRSKLRVRDISKDGSG